MNNADASAHCIVRMNCALAIAGDYRTEKIRLLYFVAKDGAIAIIF
jgi:hypothetical protein